MRTTVGLSVVLAGTVGLTALVGAASPGDVDVRLFVFRPTRLEVQRGAQVEWANRDEIIHTVTAGTPEAPTDAFRLVLEGRGATGSVRFAKQGTYAYFCERHQHMRGEIDVK
jgi:plastocyanin